MSCSQYIRECKAWCCRFLLVDWVPHKGCEDDILFLSLRGIRLIDNGTKILIPCRCRWLRNDYRCNVYTHRPKSCSAYQCELLLKQTAMLTHGKKKAFISPQSESQNANSNKGGTCGKTRKTL